MIFSLTLASNENRLAKAPRTITRSGRRAASTAYTAGGSGNNGAPPSGSNWIHEIKHDGYRLMARRDPVGIWLLTRRSNDRSMRFPLVAEASNTSRCAHA